MEPIFFASPEELRAWLEQNHDRAPELLIGYHKVKTGRRSLTPKQAIDQALCFGWIDGKGRSLGEDAWCVRFTPRRPSSLWSAINIARVAELEEQGLMHPAGLAAFRSRDPKRVNRYSHEQADIRFDPAQEAAFKANDAAWAWWQAQPPSYRKPATWWVTSAKKDETKARRLGVLIAYAAAGQRVPPLTPPGKGPGKK